MNVSSLLRGLLAIALVALAPAARAGGFSTTNVQLLQGYNFDDALGNYDDGRLTTLTLNHFSTWEHGDSFFFADLTRGRMSDEDATGAYAEWHPRLFLNGLLDQKEPIGGIIRNWGLAGEVNQGNNFYAYLGGVGFDFAVPPGWVLGLNLFYRYDKFADHQWQISPYWTVPFAVGPVPLLFTGFIDVNGTKDGAGDDAVEIWAQPELLVDVLAVAGGPKGKLHAGVEWFIHRGYGFGETEATVTSAPQIMVQWTIF